MTLKINLKSGDRLLISTSTIQVVGDGHTIVIIEGEIPVLRESDAIALEKAVHPSQQFRYLMQRAYLTADPAPLTQARVLAEQLGSMSGRALGAIAGFEEGKHFQALRESIAIDAAMAE